MEVERYISRNFALKYFTGLTTIRERSPISNETSDICYNKRCFRRADKVNGKK